MISTILVTTDGSATAQKAGAYAVGLAKQLHASILVLSVMDKRFLVSRTVPVGQSFQGEAETMDDYLREAAQNYAVEIKKLCDKEGILSTVMVKSGHPVEEIVKAAQKSSVDLIVMGSHGQSALKAATLGSVTYGVIHNDAKIPILLVKR